MSRTDELRKEIEAERTKGAGIANSIRATKRRMLYKLDEKAALSKLAQLSKEKTKDIRFLRRRKNEIDFRISTEAFTLDAERDLVRKRNAIEKELNEATKSYRLRKKVEFIDKRIEEMNKEIETMVEQLKESNKKLDDYYNEMRRISGGERRRRPQHHGGDEKHQQKPQEISIADIAIINKEESKKEEDSSVMN
jgi:uncharacterized coiled-coil DUF342 family protein